MCARPVKVDSGSIVIAEYMVYFKGLFVLVMLFLECFSFLPVFMEVVILHLRIRAVRPVKRFFVLVSLLSECFWFPMVFMEVCHFAPPSSSSTASSTSSVLVIFLFEWFWFPMVSDVLLHGAL